MSFTECLYPRLSFLGGAASVLDVGNTFVRYNESPDGKTADHIALTLDWCAVGQDLEKAITTYDKETPKQ